MSDPEWKQYQHAAANVFRRLGCNAQVEVTVRGVRASHAVDVHATFVRSSILCTWVIECKLWKSRVPKEKVLALKSIIEDLGADRGIIISEAGFQSGAEDAARGTNITLITSLEDFARTALAATLEVPLQSGASQDFATLYQYPDRSEPSELLLVGDTLITANWRSGSLSLIDPGRKVISRTLELDKYESTSPHDGSRVIRTHPPGSLAFADGRLFVGQVFSDVILVIDLATQAIVKRIPVPGGGEGSLAASADEKTIYFGSNRANQFFVIDSATYAVEAVPFPEGGRGCQAILRHPTLPLLYIGVVRGGRINGRRYPYANSYVATYDLAAKRYVADTQLAEITNGRTDDALPVCLTFDSDFDRVYVGMFQSLRGICVLEATTSRWLGDIRFEMRPGMKPFPWVDPLSQVTTEHSLLSVNRNNRDVVSLDRRTLSLRASVFLGEAANGPRDLVVWNDHVIVSYPAMNGLFYIPLTALAEPD